jgi:hypothetical protein
MHSDFKDNRKKVQKALFSTGFWKKLQDDTLILEEKKENAELKKIEITNIPLAKDIDMVYLIDLELNVPILGRTEKAKTMEKALLLITDPMVYIFMFELKSSLQADDENDISAIHNKLKDTIARMSVLLTTFVFGDNFKETFIQYKGIVFYNRHNNLINEATLSLKRKELYKVFEGPKRSIKIEHDISGIHEVEVYFCKNPIYSVSPNTFSIDFSTFIEEWEADFFKKLNMSLPQVLG